VQILKTIVHPEGNRKVEVFQRPDGTFGFEEWHWLVDEKCWCPLGKRSVSVIDTMDHTLDEIKGRIPWVTEKILGLSSPN